MAKVDGPEKEAKRVIYETFLVNVTDDHDRL